MAAFKLRYIQFSESYSASANLLSTNQFLRSGFHVPDSAVHCYHEDNLYKLLYNHTSVEEYLQTIKQE